MLRTMFALALLVAYVQPADACECGDFDDAKAMDARSLVFDGWVIEAPQPWNCPLPPAPKPRQGCVRIAVVSRQDCKARGDLLGLQGSDGSGVSYTSVDDDATTFCGVKAGRYFLGGSSTWQGPENGTLDHGRTLDIVPGGSYVIFGAGTTGQRLRVGVFRAVKGQVPREVVVTTERDCGTPFIDAGEALRFFAEPGKDGSVVVRGCWAVRALTEAERATPVAAPAPAPAPPAALGSPQQPAPAASKSGGCEIAPSPGLLLALLVLRRRRCRGASHPRVSSVS
jgi:hypothetical protein